ncbi:hypothetical protein NPIL_676771 [Nephila pilipes]|uniref:Uncharacterized protein n=1 Tax=Nephila pilipes TaxID=299642 RepID=A0A8X6MR72_NEPPI|nr:hypothetical protein NPIL_676771 [Nephila pilipes]
MVLSQPFCFAISVTLQIGENADKALCLYRGQKYSCMNRMAKHFKETGTQNLFHNCDTISGHVAMCGHSRTPAAWIPRYNIPPR